MRIDSDSPRERDPAAQPAVTVALPAFNAVATIDLAIRSMLSQSFTDFELLVLDDGSTDGTAERVRRFRDPRVVLAAGDRNEGLAARLNQAIDVARGTYFARMDADDVAYPDRLERQFRFLEAHPEVDLVGGRALVFEGDGEVLGLLPFRSSHDELCATPWRGIPLPHPTWFGRTAWFRRFRYAIPEVLRAEDQDLLLRASPQSRFACLPDIVLGYRQGPHSWRRTALARRQQFGSQWRNLGARRRWRAAWLALAVYATKSTADALVRLPLAGRLHPRQSRQMPAPEAVAQWRALWADLQRESA